jgi:hypothetical protein
MPTGLGRAIPSDQGNLQGIKILLLVPLGARRFTAATSVAYSQFPTHPSREKFEASRE